MTCQCCSSPDLKEFLDLGFHPPTSIFSHSRSTGPKTLYPLVISRCSKCGLVQSGYATDPKVLFADKEYFYWSGATPSFKKHQEDLAQQLMREYKLEFVVDIGGNDGTALRPYMEAGIKVLNVDPSSVAKESKVPVLNEFFSDGSAAAVEVLHGKADLITAFNVFAHVRDLDSFMKGVSRLLKPDGVFLTESKYLLDIIEHLHYDAFYLETLRWYSVHTIQGLLSRWGFEVFKAERIPTFGGSIRVYARKAQVRRYDESMMELLILEDEQGLDDFQTYADFGDRVKRNKWELNSLLWTLKKEGNRIAGIGAPGRSTTLINYCNLSPDLIDYLVETNPQKIGCYSPGTEIPIVDEKRLLEDNPDYVLNFLWYLHGVIPELWAKGLKSNVIEPLPEVKVYD